MIKLVNYLITGLSCLFFFSCTEKYQEQKKQILSVSLKQNEFNLSSLFKKIEIIPLETTNESLITNIGRIIEYDHKYYILDDRTSMLFCFNSQGQFLFKIDKNGNGPGEYYLIYETIVKPDENRIYMLSPMGSIYTYDMQGEFIKKDLFPFGGQQDMIEIEKDIIAYWILGPSDNNKVSFFDLNTGQVVGGFWKDTDKTFMTNLCIDVFYKYKGDNYFSTQFANEVYRFTKDTVELAYKWDFGSDNLDLEPYRERVKEDPNLFPQLTESMEIPYYFFRQFQNKDYFYTVLNSWSIDKWCNVFYRKKDGESFVFDTLPGGARVMNTSILTDEYMISVISPENISSYQKILSSEEYAKVKELREDDNLCLVKFYFN